MEQVDEPTFHQLRLGQRSDDPQDRLVGEERRALRQRMHRAGEAKIFQRSHELRAEAAVAGQPVQFLGGEPQVLQIIQCLFQTGGEQEFPFGG